MFIVRELFVKDFAWNFRCCTSGCAIKKKLKTVEVLGGMSKIFDPLMHGGNKKVRHT